MPARKKPAATKAKETQVPTVPVAGLASNLETGEQNVGGQTKFEPEKHIVINGLIYERASFSEEHVRAISMVNFADQQIANATQNLHISKLGRDELVKALLEDIKDVEAIGQVPEAEAE